MQQPLVWEEVSAAPFEALLHQVLQEDLLEGWTALCTLLKVGW